MAITHTSQFDRARRRVYVRYVSPAKTIAGLVLPDRDSGNIPYFLPTSLVLEGTDQYIESNGFYTKVNSVDAWQDVYFIPPPWGEIEAVEDTNKPVMEFFAADAPSQLLHSFNIQ